MAAADLALAVHRHLGGDDQTLVLAGHGFSPADVARALRLATVPLADQEAATNRAGTLLVSLRAPGCRVETVEVRTLVTDETPAERLERMEGAGWFDAVIHREPRELQRTGDAEAYARGRTAFLAALEAERVSA